MRLVKGRPISCSECPAFERLQTSRFSIAESPNRFSGLLANHETIELTRAYLSNTPTCEARPGYSSSACTPGGFSSLKAQMVIEIKA